LNVFDRASSHWDAKAERRSGVSHHLHFGVLLFAVLLVASLAACGSLAPSRLYVHDDSAQKAAEAAQTAWRAALPSSVFDQQKAFLVKLAADEVETAKIEIAAQRDLQLVQLVDGTGDSAVGEYMEDRLKALAGVGTLAAGATLDKRIRDDREAIDNDTALVNIATAQLKVDGYTGTLPTCDDPQAAPPGATDNQVLDFTVIATDCTTLNNKENELNCDLGGVSTVGTCSTTGRYVTGSTGKLFDTLQTLSAAMRDLKRQQTQAVALQKLLDAKKKEIDAAQQGSRVAQDAAKALKFCLADPGSASDQTAASPTNGATLGTEINTCVVSAANDADPLVKQLKHTALSTEIQSVLTSMLNANAGISTTAGVSTAATTGSKPAPAAPTSASTTAALGTLDGLADAAAAISKGHQPSVNALLVALAYEQYQADVNANQVQTLKQRISIYEDRRDAYVDEISFLAGALQELAKPVAHAASHKSGTRRDQATPVETRDIGRVRAYLNSAWNIGAYRVLLTQYAEDDLTRSDALRVSSTIATAWQNVLQPAFDELVAYGKGGLDAQTVSNLVIAVVNAGGLAAVAKGVNK
jgi:hypothetical protein